jgi:hypothetical protein
VVKGVSARQVRQAVLSKGFAPAEHGTRDHEMYFFMDGARKTSLWVKLSRGAKMLHLPEIKRNAKSVGLTGDDLYRILSCEHSAATTRGLFVKLTR